MRGLYIHIPFCAKKCPYCDFYSLPLSLQKAEEYKNAVIRNLSRYKEKFDTVYFGGGTPTLIFDKIAEILSEVDLEENAEITIECNPESAGEEVLSELKRAGANRLSFGVQSLDERELSALGRTHSAKAAKESILLAYKLGFENISADLMLGVPNQTPDSLEKTIDELCRLPITHVSAYLLKIEPNTVFGKNPREISDMLPDEDMQAELYLSAVELLEKHGFMQYEISNFAKPGFESLHNLKYWRAEEYVGIGPSAHSYYEGWRFAVPKNLAKFLDNEFQLKEITDFSPDKDEEKILLGLRLCEGIVLSEKIKRRLILIPKEYYMIINGRFSLTPRGFLVSNEIIATLLK
ncbi:MAG: radical SAM family heme chaperone HemW [Oscillospiraceae bacterium]|nr:radical SAM family heme chaperone HemW [Oscillospiraceae bacterium]